MNICVVGAGAIGGWIAARLALAGNDVSVVARGETLAAIETEALWLTDGGDTRCVAVAASSDPAALGVHGVVIIAVKAPALPRIALSLEALVGPDTQIVPMMNGVPWWFTDDPLWSVDPDLAIADALPAEQVAGCVVHASCFRTGPNRVTVKHADKLILGEPDGGSSERIERLCTLFANAGIHCEESENIRRAIWYKLWGNATINPMSALTRSTADKLLHDAIIRASMAEAMDELAAVGAAIACPIEESAADRMAVTARLGAFKSSMLQDVEASRAIELEALLGAPREIAKRIGIATPQLDRLYAMTRLMSENLGLQ
ncbi:ketopantoate reductase family protein [Sphingomonas segetis]|jgi:2-dehydropantoate 2-reductase|uniref:ketopantoate reductase family protein n=1 Tax=Sphingomonas segetis TaxID=1104779 RepID=UPI0012D357E4|nr:2-dehydropantoate 2-reductase [Sphingomonas segetis]